MTDENEKLVNCSEFEEVLTDYLDGVLDRQTHKAVAAHTLRLSFVSRSSERSKRRFGALPRDFRAENIQSPNWKQKFSRKPRRSRRWRVKNLKIT